MIVKNLLYCKKSFLLLLSLLFWGLQVTQSHVGSPGVVFEGTAGPYSLLVSVDPPDVIPGIAEISIYASDPRISNIQVKPIYWGVGDEGSPKSDPMDPVPGVPGQFEGIVWFMSTGTASIAVYVDGEKGSGEAIIPIMASATAQKDMDASLGWTLAGLGLFLAILMVTIISASVGLGIVAPGEEAKNLKPKKQSGGMVATALLILLIWGGKIWWDNESAAYKSFMYKPPQAHSWVEQENGNRIMTFQIDSISIKNSNRLPMKYMVADHGKLMHMFIIKEGSLDVFAHLHPKRVDPLTFKVQLPEIPEGRYYVFGDIVRRNGYTETISDTLDIPAHKAADTTTNDRRAWFDPDDTYIVSTAVDQKVDDNLPSDILICGKPGIETPLLDGSTAVFEYQPNQSFIAGKVYPLTFAINDPEGNPAVLEPYMGMMGHAVVFRKEGGVYVHLHPVGNYSMASQQILEDRIAENSPSARIAQEADVFYDSVNQVVAELAMLTEEERTEILMQGMEHTGLGEHEEHGSTVTFPYAFPQEGNYRIWIQMKRNGKVLNSSFDAKVTL